METDGGLQRSMEAWGMVGRQLGWVEWAIRVKRDWTLIYKQ